MKKIPKLLTSWQTLLADNTRVKKPMIIQPIKRKLKPGEMWFKLPNGQITVINPNLKNAEFRLNTYADELLKPTTQLQELKKKKALLDKASDRTLEVGNAILERTMPSYWLEKATNEKANPVEKLAFDLAIPWTLGKGILLGAKYVPRGLQLLNSPITGKWTQFGNNVYRMKPGYIYSGFPGAIERKNIIDELSTHREMFPLSSLENLTTINLDEISKNFETIIPFSTLDSKLGIKDSKRLFSTLENTLEGDPYVLENGVAFETSGEAKLGLNKLNSYLNLINRTRGRNEPRYTSEEIESMLNADRTGLKDGQMLESFYPGSHGTENWYDRSVKSTLSEEIKRKLENVRRYLRTVFGRMKKEDVLDLRYYNPKGRSGVILPNDLDKLLSSDSSIMTLQHLLRELLSGRKFLLFNSNNKLQALNLLGLKNSFRLKQLDEGFGNLITENPELINQFNIRETKLPGYMTIHSSDGKKLLATLKQRSPEEIAETLNKLLELLNNEFAKYNIKINPFTFDNINVYLPNNMSGILYGKGGKIEKI